MDAGQNVFAKKIAAYRVAWHINRSRVLYTLENFFGVQLRGAKQQNMAPTVFRKSFIHHPCSKLLCQSSTVEVRHNAFLQRSKYKLSLKSTFFFSQLNWSRTFTWCKRYRGVGTVARLPPTHRLLLCAVMRRIRNMKRPQFWWKRGQICTWANFAHVPTPGAEFLSLLHKIHHDGEGSVFAEDRDYFGHRAEDLHNPYYEDYCQYSDWHGRVKWIWYFCNLWRATRRCCGAGNVNFGEVSFKRMAQHLPTSFIIGYALFFLCANIAIQDSFSLLIELEGLGTTTTDSLNHGDIILPCTDQKFGELHER